MLRSKTCIQQTGFALVELLPAALLLAVLSTVTLRALSLDMQLRQRAQFEARVKESLSLALDRWQQPAGKVIVCSLLPGEEWTVVDYPDESWLPPGIGEAEWIMWKHYLLHGPPDNCTAFAYRSNVSDDWKEWIYVLDWQLPTLERIAARQERSM